MINLAGKKDANNYIREELTRCGIPIENVPQTNSEVPYTLIGKTDYGIFRRAWYYWVFEGKVPLAVAEELYKSPVGKRDIRVSGHCGCPAPEGDYITRFGSSGKPILSKEYWAAEREKYKDSLALSEVFDSVEEKHELCSDCDMHNHPAFITSYHIDSELGLYIFAKAMNDANVHV